MGESSRTKSPRGFTLTELLVIVAVVVLLAAIVLPNLLRSRLAANEAAAIASLNIINHAEASYQVSYPANGYAETLAALGPPGPDEVCQSPTATHACLIGASLAQANSPEHPKNGYWVSLRASSHNAGGVVSSYVVWAAPELHNKTGVRAFCSLEDGVIRFNVPMGNTEPSKRPADCVAMTPLE